MAIFISVSEVPLFITIHTGFRGKMGHENSHSQCSPLRAVRQDEVSRYCGDRIVSI